MMSEQDNIPLDALISRHETQSGVTREDEMAVAQLFKTVGDELYTVDHANVGGQSNKALQLDKGKVFNSIPRSPNPVQVPVQQAPVQQAPVPQAPVPQSNDNQLDFDFTEPSKIDKMVDLLEKQNLILKEISLKLDNGKKVKINKQR